MAKKRGKSATSMKDDVGHSRALSKGGTNSLMNLFMQNPGQNRSFSRTAQGAMKSELSNREKKKGLRVSSQKRK